MAITATDILYKLSVTTGPGNSTAGTPATSLGEFISTTQITDATLHNLFDLITGDENAAGDVEYRCIFVHNNHATLTWENVVVWLSAEVADGAVAAISVDTTAASAVGSASAQAKEVVNESTAPATQTFTAPTTKGTGLSIGNLTAGQVRGIWIRRTATAGGALNNDGVTIRCEGDTAA
jgi:hypothetical protein